MAERQTRKNGALRDPLRSAMMAHIEGMPLLLLCAALCAAFCFAALNLCAQMEGAVWIALAGTLGVALLMLGIGKTVRGQPVIVLLCAALLAMVAVGAHLAMLDIRPARMSNVLQPMLDGMWNYELVTAMAWEENAWSGVYLIVMGLVSRLERFPQMYALKLFDMICQCGAALAILRLARMRGAKPLGALTAMFAGGLAPTMRFNAGCWAQCDATFALFTLWGLALLLEDHPLAGCILWGVALGTKLQSAFLFPLLIVWWMNGRVSLRHILVLAAAFVACQAAILLAALLLAAGLPLILPQMNARCLYLAGLLAFICANSPRRMLVAGMLEFISFCSYMEAVFSKTVLPITVLSILAIAVAALIAQELIALLTDRGGSKGALAHEGQA